MLFRSHLFICRLLFAVDSFNIHHLFLKCKYFFKKISIFLFFSNFSFKKPCIYAVFATKKFLFFVPEKKCHGSSTAFHGISQLFISVSDCFLFLYILRRLCWNEYAGFLFFVFMKCCFLSCLNTEFHLREIGRAHV